MCIIFFQKLFQLVLILIYAPTQGLSKQLLGATLNKHFHVRCSDWEADDLTDVQVKYAAQDAIASIAVCLKLVEETSGSFLGNTRFGDVFSFYQSWSRECPLKDTKFHLKSGASFTATAHSSKAKSFTPSKPNKY